jgi:hypothetical protein
VQGKAELVIEVQRVGCGVRFHGENHSAQFNCAQFVYLNAADSQIS